MSSPIYDLVKLGRSGSIDTLGATRFFYNYQEYYDALTLFLEECPQYLNNYNPTFIIYNEDNRNDFMNECATIRATLTRLGMTLAMLELNNMDDAVRNSDTKALSDGLLKFHATLDITAKEVLSARFPDDYQPPEKPLIIAVDDRPIALTVINDMLSEHYNVITHTNAIAALNALNTHTPALFILDIEMPEINGYELALLIREKEQFIKTPILFVSGKTSRKNVLKAMTHSINVYLSKPVDKTVLLQTIERLLHMNN